MLSLDAAYEQALRSAVRLETPPALRLIRLTGPQRRWFLQNTITADVDEDDVPAGRAVESCFLDPKGRVQAHFRAGFFEEQAWLDVEPDAASNLAEWFTRYRFRTKVEIETVRKPCITVLGPGAEAYSAPGTMNTAGPAGSVAFGYKLGELSVADVHIDEPGALTPLGGLPEAPHDLYDVFRIEAGIGAFGIDFGTRELPQEAGLTRMVSVEKGCYVGQETVARIHFRGHVNKVLRPLIFDGADESLVGRELTLDGGVVGRITSAIRSPRKGVVGIGMVRVEPPAGACLDVEGGGTAELGPLPEGTKVKTPG